MLFRFIFFIFLVVNLYSSQNNSRSLKSINLSSVNINGKNIDLYSKSYALLIGVSRYKNWPSIESIPSELENIATVLQENEFNVKTVLNPDSRELKFVFEDFINKYGYDEKNRLLVYYAGHGETINGKGYLVPTDAPIPEKNKLREFKRKSLNMTRILSLSREAESNHMVFLFDSCFSGTIFKTRSLPKISKKLNKIVAEPVRYFITAGSANEPVPAKSVFSKLFVNSLREGTGDMNKDGYITGRELGYYLRMEVPKFTQQTPQSGTINDYELSRGDFIFVFNSDSSSTEYTKKKVQHATPHSQGIKRYVKAGAIKEYNKEWNYLVVTLDKPMKVNDTIYLKVSGEYYPVKIEKIQGLKASVVTSNYDENEKSIYRVSR
ncbi:caspase family protein [Sulfurimonas sp.]|nr:caspase family protein [Sulfurimonas sp.]